MYITFIFFFRDLYSLTMISSNTSVCLPCTIISCLTVNNPTGIFQAPSFSLRGKTPLMVIDGVPVESDLFDVSPENIESINVLKGTAAAALYGSRGKDGAILITTKLAKEDGLTVTAGLSSMVSAGFTVFPETQTEFGSGSNGQYAFWDGADGGISDGTIESLSMDWCDAGYCLFLYVEPFGKERRN